MCVTTFSDAGYKEYGKKMIETFNQYWHPSIPLMVFCDSEIMRPSERIQTFSLSNYPKIQAFTDRHKNNPAAHGKEPNHFWQEKEKLGGYSFRFDAVRFHYSAMVPYYAACHLLKTHNEGTLIFLDGDVLTKARVSCEWVNKITSKRKHITYLGRTGGKSSETGFVGYKLPESMKFLETYHDAYDNDSIFQMGETANAYVFDRVMLLRTSKSKRNNLTPDNKKSHIWNVSPLVEKMDHLKGQVNKAAGKPIIR